MNDWRPHVGLDAYLLSGAAGYRSAGIHGYIAELLQRLPSADAGIRYTAFSGQSASSWVSTLPARLTRWPTEKPILRIVWEQVFLPGVCVREHLGLLHGLAFVSPLLCPCPTIITVHDLSFALFPEFFRGPNGMYLRLFTRMACRRAAKIIAVSENTRADAMRLYDVPGERIAAIPHGVSPAFHPRPPAQVAEFRRARGLPDHFILFVGTLEPRKNLVRLIQAFSNIRSRRSPRAGEISNLKLVLIGGKGWYYDQIFAAIERMDLQDRVILVGYVPNEDLPLWYNAADVFAFPSRYEGFGLPVLEAMACGTPTVTSTASSLPEVAGDAALTVPPDDVVALSAALDRALTDGALRQELSSKGSARAATFTWEETARRTAAVYRQALSCADNVMAAQVQNSHRDLPGSHP
jgi:glycosyltransferase involved in cell wall biosynthesis